MRRGLLIGSIGLALAAALPAAGHAATPNACAALTKAEVAAAIGEGVAKTVRRSTSSGAGTCNFLGDDDSLFQKGVTLIVARDHAKGRYTAFRAAADSPSAVKGLGAKAYEDQGQIVTYQGSAFVSISALYNDSGVTEDALVALARKALKRLA